MTIPPNAVAYVSHLVMTGIGTYPTASRAFTQPAGTNRIGLVMDQSSQGKDKLTSVTWGGVPMTLVDTGLVGKPPGGEEWPTQGEMECWYILEENMPADGSINIVFNNSGVYSYGVAVASVFQYCEQATPYQDKGSQVAGAVSASLPIDSYGMAYLAGLRAGGGTTVTGWGTGQTEMYKGDYSNYRYTRYCGSYEVGEAAPSMTYGDPASTGIFWIAIGINAFVPVSNTPQMLII